MATYTVADDLLVSAEAAEYFQSADRRILIGLRAALELLGLPVPGYAERKPPGPKAASTKVIARLHAADNGLPIPRRTYAANPYTETRVAAALAKALNRHA